MLTIIVLGGGGSRLGWNRFQGQLLSTWALPRMQSLSINDNNLEGPLPANIFGQATSLRQLNLSGNSLSGSLPAFKEPLQLLYEFPVYFSISYVVSLNLTLGKCIQILIRTFFLVLLISPFE